MILDLLLGKISSDEAYRLFQERNPPLGSGLGVTREEALEEMEGVLERGLDHCVTGKFQINKALADRKLQLKEKLSFKDFFDDFISLGPVAFSMLRWEILGLDDEAKKVIVPTRLSSVIKKIGLRIPRLQLGIISKNKRQRTRRKRLVIKKGRA